METSPAFVGTQHVLRSVIHGLNIDLVSGDLNKVGHIEATLAHVQFRVPHVPSNTNDDPTNSQQTSHQESPKYSSSVRTVDSRVVYLVSNTAVFLNHLPNHPHHPQNSVWLARIIRHKPDPSHIHRLDVAELDILSSSVSSTREGEDTPVLAKIAREGRDRYRPSPTLAEEAQESTTRAAGGTTREGPQHRPNGHHTRTP